MDELARRTVGALALSFVVMAVAAGSAAAEHPDNRAGALGVGGIASDVATRAVIPNDRGGELGVGAIEGRRAVVVPAQPDDRGGVHTPAPVSSVAPFVSQAPSGDFHWEDAALGAAAAVGLMALGVLAAALARHRTRVILP